MQVIFGNFFEIVAFEIRLVS